MNDHTTPAAGYGAHTHSPTASSRHALRRRTLLGTAAAVGLGTLDGARAAPDDPTAADTGATPDDSHLAGYANRVGRISQAGLNEAFDD